MLVYGDSSALIKRSVEEAESEALDGTLDQLVADGASIVSSSLAWVEVSRALRSLVDHGHNEDEINEAIEIALSGVAERPMTEDVIALARRIAPPALRTLDAIHLSTAVLIDADVVLSYDDRLIDACRSNGLTTQAPGR